MDFLGAGDYTVILTIGAERVVGDECAPEALPRAVVSSLVCRLPAAIMLACVDVTATAIDGEVGARLVSTGARRGEGHEEGG